MDDIVEEIRALQEHYIHSVRTPEANLRWLTDYASDLKGFNFESIQLACKSWRQSDAKRFPTPGQLMDIAIKLKPKNDHFQAVAWTKLSQDEYDALPLVEKIRQQRLMASHERGKAGPMWSGTGPLRPDQMSDNWHAHRTRAKHHDDEAHRLMGVLSTAKGRQEGTQ